MPCLGRVEDRLDLVLVALGRSECADRRYLRLERRDDDVDRNLLDLRRVGFALPGQKIVGRSLDPRLG